MSRVQERIQENERLLTIDRQSLAHMENSSWRHMDDLHCALGGVPEQGPSLLEHTSWGRFGSIPLKNSAVQRHGPVSRIFDGPTETTILQRVPRLGPGYAAIIHSRTRWSQSREPPQV